MAIGKKTGGRSKGTPNKITTTAKEAIEAAAKGLGGTERLIAWAKEDEQNERTFWGMIYPKLLPLQVNASHSIDEDLAQWFNRR